MMHDTFGSSGQNFSCVPQGDLAPYPVPTYTAADGVHPRIRPARTVCPPAQARSSARRGRWKPAVVTAERTRGVSWLVRALALLACCLALLTGCAASFTRQADGSYTLSVDGREQRLYEAGASPVAADARPLDQLALERAGGDARAAHEALLAAVDAVWALLARLNAAATLSDAQAAVLRNAAAAQREAGAR